MKTNTKKVNNIINDILTWKKQLKNKNLCLSLLYKRLEQLENE